MEASASTWPLMMVLPLVQGGALLSQDALPPGRQPAVASASTSGHSLMLGADNGGAAVAQRPLAALGSVSLDAAAGSAKRRRPADSAAGTADAALPTGLSGDEDVTGNSDIPTARDSTFGERVAALRVLDLPAAATAAAEDGQQAADGSITADSLSVLLTQVPINWIAPRNEFIANCFSK